MKENEAIEQLQNEYLVSLTGRDGVASVRYHNEALDTAIAALKEVQEYHATGRTPSMVRALQVAYIRAKKRLDKYIAIGTSEDCQIAIERRTEKPVKDQKGTTYIWASGYCPVCGTGITSRWNYCQNCGQKVKWEPYRFGEKEGDRNDD